MHNPTLELQQLVENVVYFELKRRRYKVSTGRVKDREVDFVTQGNDGQIRYIQVAVSITNQEKLDQELAVFKLIKDNYPKYIFTRKKKELGFSPFSIFGVTVNFESPHMSI